MLCPGCIGASASWDLQGTPDRGGDAAALLLLLLLPFLSTKEKKKYTFEYSHGKEAHLRPDMELRRFRKFISNHNEFMWEKSQPSNLYFFPEANS